MIDETLSHVNKKVSYKMRVAFLLVAIGDYDVMGNIVIKNLNKWFCAGNDRITHTTFVFTDNLASSLWKEDHVNTIFQKRRG